VARERFEPPERGRGGGLLRVADRRRRALGDETTLHWNDVAAGVIVAIAGGYGGYGAHEAYGESSTGDKSADAANGDSEGDSEDESGDGGDGDDGSGTG
jgi:hypothetical protein